MKKMLTVALLSAVFMSGCTVNPNTGERQTSKTVKYGAIAGGTGAVLGALVGGKQGALIGGGVGALAGGAYGGYTDVQEKKLRESLQGSGAQVQRMEDNSLKIVVPSDVTFETGNSNIQTSFYPYLNELAKAMVQNNSHMVISGHTDNTGSAKLNQNLSLARANNVANYLYAQGVPNGNIATQGLSFTMPIATNDTPEGRAKNRRVEFLLK